LAFLKTGLNIVPEQPKGNENCMAYVRKKNAVYKSSEVCRMALKENNSPEWVSKEFSSHHALQLVRQIKKLGRFFMAIRLS